MPRWVIYGVEKVETNPPNPPQRKMFYPFTPR